MFADVVDTLHLGVQLGHNQDWARLRMVSKGAKSAYRVCGAREPKSRWPLTADAKGRLHRVPGPHRR